MYKRGSLMKKTLLFSFIAVLVIILAIGILSNTALAAPEGYYTYTRSTTGTTITYVDRTISGDITIPSTLGGYPVTKIGTSAFSTCYDLTNVIIPDTVTSVGESAFHCCTSLTSINIPNSVTSIGYGAFYNCTSLTRITIPNSVKTIDDYAFSTCTSLTRITIPNSVRIIEDYAFSTCTSLTSVTIPNSIRSIEYHAFNGCTNLETVYYTGTEEEWNKIVIKDYNAPLLNAEIIFAQSNPIEDAIDGTVLTTATVVEETVIIVPTIGNVAMTEDELRAIFNDDTITITSNNGIIGTGCKVTIGEYEVELVVKGDIDGDGVATVFDALMVKKALANNGFENEALREFAADVDGTEGTTEADVSAILAIIVGK